MPVIINGTTGVSSSNVAASDTVSTGPAGIRFGDSTTQTTASSPSVPQMQVFTAPGTFSIPPTTTRVKVTIVGGGGGGQTITNGGFDGSAGASGGTTSFGSYATATGGAPSARGTSPGSTIDDMFLSKYGSSGHLSSLSYSQTGGSAYSTPTFNTTSSGGVGIKIINAPFPVTSVPVTVGAGGGGGGQGGAGSTINGGPGSTGVSGGGAAGLSAPYQGTGGPVSPGGTAPQMAARTGQPGAGPFNRTGGGNGGIVSGEGTATIGGGGGFQGVVIVEY